MGGEAGRTKRRLIDGLLLRRGRSPGVYMTAIVSVVEQGVGVLEREGVGAVAGEGVDMGRGIDDDRGLVGRTNAMAAAGTAPPLHRVQTMTSAAVEIVDRC